MAWRITLEGKYLWHWGGRTNLFSLEDRVFQRGARTSSRGGKLLVDMDIKVCQSSVRHCEWLSHRDSFFSLSRALDKPASSDNPLVKMLPSYHVSKSRKLHRK